MAEAKGGRPWRVDESANEHACCFITAIVDASGVLVCDVCEEDAARLIVAAVNAFEGSAEVEAKPDPRLEALLLPKKKTNGSNA